MQRLYTEPTTNMAAFPSPNKALIGMVHARALPGTPKNKLSVDEICRIAAEDARRIHRAGFDAVLVENMHDLPYLRRSVGPEITAAMTMVVAAVRAVVGCPVGIQVLAGANREALAIALATGASFIRAEGLVFAHVADEGIMESDAGELLRYRRAIGAESVKIFGDIKKKHSSHAITADVNLEETAAAAEFCGADGVIVTGTRTGAPTDPADLVEAGRGTKLPRFVGSGITPENLPALWHHAEGFIVGSWIKKNGKWEEAVDPSRASQLVHLAAELRETPRPAKTKR